MEGAEVRYISWFGRQTVWSLAQLFVRRLQGYKVMNLNWLPFNNLMEMRMARWACHLLGIRVIWTVHNLSPHSVQFGSREADQLAMCNLRDWADRGVVHSERTRAEFQSQYGNMLPMDVIPLANYLDIIVKADPDQSRKKLLLPSDKVVVLMIGPNRWNKGIRSYLRVVSSLPDNYLGVLAGGCKDPEIADLIRRFESEHPGRFRAILRRLDDNEIAEYYAASDIFFMPFEDITTSGSIMEAISQGKAVVSTDRGNMSMLVRNGVNGYLAETEDEMKEWLLSIDRDTARSMGERSLEIAKSFPWNDSARHYMAIFEQMLVRQS
ncbi:MAG: glycosyltransferase family 4 protein [Methanomassiliicoccus sp.]|nr:glycosyltransferase family 4 protein [Methanomassiliicoccus sp.]